MQKEFVQYYMEAKVELHLTNIKHQRIYFNDAKSRYIILINRDDLYENRSMLVKFKLTFKKISLPT